MASASKACRSSIIKPLYRNLLRVVKLYSSSEHSNILCSLLHRSGTDDLIDYSKLRIPPSQKASKSQLSSSNDLPTVTKYEAMDLSRSYKEIQRSTLEDNDDDDEVDEIMDDFLMSDNHSSSSLPPYHIILYKQLLREIIGLSRHMHFPSTIESHKQLSNSNREEPDDISNRLLKVIRREFRDSSSNDSKQLSSSFTDIVRRQAAFLALRELNKKLTWLESLGFDMNTNTDPLEKKYIQRRNKIQKARGTSPLRTHGQPPKSYLRPGSYLVAHPLLSGYFSRSVIAILDHTDDYNTDPTQMAGGTYGLVVNRPSLIGGSQNNSKQSDSGHGRTLSEVIRPNCLPRGLREAFGNNPVREGGPVNLSLQMIYSATSEQEDKLQIGGTILPMIASTNPKDTSASHTDRAIYYQGDVIKAAQSVIDNEMDPGAIKNCNMMSLFQIFMLQFHFCF